MKTNSIEELSTMSCSTIATNSGLFVVLTINSEGEPTSVVLDYENVRQLVGFLTDYLVDVDDLYYDED